MMWMMGYNDGGSEFNNNIQDPITGRKLRPLMPRPATAAAASTNPPNCIHGTDLRALNHHLAAMAEQNKRSSELNSQQVVVSSRWNPTPEQLQTLEELYRRGTRTPSADQIQHITAQLRRYGKIEGKNVFYWFQNHKARERQKRRRCLESLSDEQQQQNQNNSGEKRDSTGGNRTVYEVEQTKNWASPTNSSTIPTEKTLSTQEGATGTESKADGWTQMEEEFQLQRRNATWQMMNNLSSSSSSTAPHTVLTSGINQSTVISNPHHDFVHIISLEPYKYDPENLDPSSNGGESTAQTLELFPLHSTNQTLNEEEESGAAICGDSFTPYQFFEFLPLKN